MPMSLIDSTGSPMIQKKTFAEHLDIVLNLNNITMKTNYIGERRRGDWDCDAWIVEFRNNNSDKSSDFEFFTGMAHRAELTEKQKESVKLGFPGLTTNDLKNNNLYAKKYRAACEAARKPTAPDSASVLHSLILDSSAVGQSFDSWCNNYGYDSDSRKAYGIYEACQKNADKLNRIMSHALIAELSELLQDY